MTSSDIEVVKLDEGWSQVQDAIRKLTRILEGEPEPQFTFAQYMILYTTIFNMCNQKPPHDYSQQLYDKYRVVIEEYIRTHVLPSLREKHDEFLLMEFVKRWSNYKIMVRWLSRFFHYLDRYFVLASSLPSLNEVGLTCFRDLVYETFKKEARKAVIDLINRERDGEHINRALLKDVLDIFVANGMGKMDKYTNDFEYHMLMDTAGYYARTALNWIVEDSCPDYMLKAEESLRKENDRVGHYLHSSTRPKLWKIVQLNLLVVSSNELLEKENSGCRDLLRDNKMDDLSRMYRLFHKVTEGLNRIANMFMEHVIAEGTDVVQQAEDAASNKASKKEDNARGAPWEQVFVRNLIELHRKYMMYVNDCFQNNPLFHKALNQAFEVFCNKVVAGSSIAELLASLCDNVLKKGGSEKLTDEAIEETLDTVVKLLAYVADKDLFAELYREKLGKRLLSDKSLSDVHERHIISKLKHQCDWQFTSKMEEMVTDLTLAKEHQTNFQEYISNNPDVKLRIDLKVTVLATGYCPRYKYSDIRLPEEMVKCVEIFEGFYQTKTKNRKLTWIYSMGSCNINCKFDSKPIELIVGTYQAAALMLFNSIDKLSYSEIRTQLNLADEDLARVLHSLSCAKYKILLKNPSSKTISPTDSFEFNPKFTDKMRKIRIPLPPPDRNKIVEDVDKDRRYAIDACIVRIMKSRKVLSYQQLNLECIQQLSRMFKPDFTVIKNRIEDLIMREYLERDSDNPNLFKYLA